MREEYLPVCFFPTTVVLVDDNAKYLHNLSAALDNDIAVYKTFDIPMRADDYFSDIYHFNPFTNRCLIKPEDEELEHRVIDVDVRKIHREFHYAERFAQISVLVVDYSMPGMDGLALCEQITSAAGPIKKILLTGEADESLAVDAFNRGIIDRFIRKDARKFYQLINSTIYELQTDYFKGISKVVVDSMKGDSSQPGRCISDPIFIRYFKEICKKHHIVEYYLVDSSGGFLLLDVLGRPSWLAVKNEGEVRDLYEFAYSEHAPDDVLQALNSREQIPYFHTDDELQTPPTQWGKFLHDAELIQGDDLYYCALITDHKTYDISSEHVVSFDTYREEQA